MDRPRATILSHESVVPPLQSVTAYPNVECGPQFFPQNNYCQDTIDLRGSTNFKLGRWAANRAEITARFAYAAES